MTPTMVRRGSRRCKDPRYAPRMAAGGIVMAVLLLLIVPVGVMLGGAAWSALMNFFLGDDADRRASEPAPEG